MIVKNAGLVLKVGRQTALAPRPVGWTLRHGVGDCLLWPLIPLIWITMSVFLAWDMWRNGETWGLLMPAIFLLIGAWLFLFCIRTATWRRRETIGTDCVTVEERDSCGGSLWSEPLARYRGIAVVEVERRRQAMLGRLKVVILDHERADRRVVLWSQMLSRDVGGWQEGYAGWLDLPMVKALPWQAPAGSDKTAVVQRT